MLDIKTIRKIFKSFKVEGFTLDEYCHRDTLDYQDGEESYWTYLDNPKKAYYFLFLNRAIEAINEKQGRFTIDQSVLGISVNDHEGNSDWYSIVSDSIDEAKEKAIIYIMDHIKEKV